jgi:hypothetical protein
VFEVDDPKLIVKNMHWTKFVLLLMQNTIVESIVSVSPLLVVPIYYLIVRFKILLSFCGGFVCGRYINRETGKVNNLYSEYGNGKFLREVGDSVVRYNGSSSEETIAQKECEHVVQSNHHDEKMKCKNFNREQYKFNPNPLKEKKRVCNNPINDENSLYKTTTDLVHNQKIAPVENCGDLVNIFSGKSKSENSDTKIDGGSQSREDNNCDHSSCNHSLEDLPPLTSDDEKYLNYAPGDDEGEASSSGEVEVDTKPAALGRKSFSKPLKSVKIGSNNIETQTPARRNKKKKKRTRNRGLKQKQPYSSN